MNVSSSKRANRLINQTSPYLLQHAYNPVDWFPWSDEAWEKARRENKLVLISIGYSACHWCHVMERECFEDSVVAERMNKKFVCIKVDREERPDIDHVYMTAVQIMTGSGGWPLNCFTLPNGKPIYGGTYFPKQKWINVLNSLSDLFDTDPEKIYQYAEELTDALKKIDLISHLESETTLTKETLIECMENWAKRFDNEEGGVRKVPKFPLPNNYQFLLRQYYFTKETPLIRHIELTLTKMAFGGIFDQIGGGFARYSTDAEWKVPHFEKMLYDNAQMVSLYSEAYQLTKNPIYKQVVYDTLEFIKRELTSYEGAFYSALDADSDGEEGKYYTWTKQELMEILGNDFTLFAYYFNVNETEEWEGKYILLRKKTDEEIAKKFGINTEDLQRKISELKKKVLIAREKRIKPGLDNKILASWNALMAKAYIDAYLAFDEKDFLTTSQKNINYIFSNLTKNDGGVYHARGIDGFLEDYCFIIEALIALYQTTFEEPWLFRAKKLAEYTLVHFYDAASGFFYFTRNTEEALIARKMETQDNVTPSSNSSIARSFFYLGRFFDQQKYVDIAEKMVKHMTAYMTKYGSAYSNWAILAQHFIYPFYEIVIVGNSVDEKKKEFSKHFIPNAIFAGGNKKSNLTLVKEKFIESKTLIYICKDKACKLPVETVSDALLQIE